MVSFLGFTLNGWFLGAGLACAAAPLIIHLLNRRRFRTVNWAAMDFLRQALQRNRRILQIRDLLLLALRTLAVLLFALALAQPLWKSRGGEKFDGGKPLHAVMIVDNSLSMAYDAGNGDTSLSRAKERAAGFIKELPSGSRISVVPLCGSPGGYSLDPYRSAEEATEALDRIEVVDRAANVEMAKNAALKAAEAEPNFAKRMVFLSDQQQVNWNQLLNAASLADYPEMQVVDVAPKNPENAWISAFRLDDDVTDAQSPARFVVRVRYMGVQERDDAQISLYVRGEDGQYIESGAKQITLQPGAAEQEVGFTHTFSEFAPEAGGVNFVPVKVELANADHDRLSIDNERYLMVPVVSALPVVFVDELGAAEENRAQNHYGETRFLRRWFSPAVTRGDASRTLAKIVHVKLEDLSPELLSGARLVVVAGVEDPAEKVDLLREYVVQGGQLLIAAGGAFDPAAWNEAAWRDGQGILPAPLKGELIGELPGVSGAKFDWFELSYDAAMRSNGLFHISGESDKSLADLYTQPWFFQAVDVDVPGVEKVLRKVYAQRLAEELSTLAQAAARNRQWERIQEDQLTDQQRQQQAADAQAVEALRPQWLTWAERPQIDELASLAGKPEEIEAAARKLVAAELPQVLARYNNGHPYLVERRIGAGRVRFASSGVKPEWNKLADSYAIALFDRLMRDMLRATIPQRNFTAQQSIALPVAGNTGGLEIELTRPAAEGEAADAIPEPEPLTVSFIGAQTRGVTIHDALRQGIYSVTAYRRPGSADPQARREKAWEKAIAVRIADGDDAAERESDLTPLTQAEFQERTAGEAVPLRWVGAGQIISLEGTAIGGQFLWKLLAVVVLILLLVEIAILAWPALTQGPAAAPPESAAPGAP